VNADQMALAERVRHLLVHTALGAYEDAAMRGLCSEGAWEAAISALRQVDLSGLLIPSAVPQRSPGEDS
jgi:hypothetical protein